MSAPTTFTDNDPLIQCDLMESRDVFLNFAREKRCEFSSLRRAKYSSMVALIDLHASTADRVCHMCNSCRQACDIRYHCSVCEGYDLCSKCYSTIKHEHPMARANHGHDASSSSDTPINAQQQRQLSFQRMIEAIRHTVNCRNANCLIKTCSQCKILLKHVNDCVKGARNQCALCNRLFLPVWQHVRTCTDQFCIVSHDDEQTRCSNSLFRLRFRTVRASSKRYCDNELPLLSWIVVVSSRHLWQIRRLVNHCYHSSSMHACISTFRFRSIAAEFADF
jgi:hypothetical protein